MKNFKLTVPTKIFFGREICEKAIDEINDSDKVLSGNVMVVTTGRSLKRLGYVDRIFSLVGKHADNVIVFDEISANPRLTEVESAVGSAVNEGCDTIVGFGGGSALDAAKAIAAGAVSESTVTDMFRRGVSPERALPIIAIPTTAGTGSELSRAAILNDEEMCIKGGLRGDALFPKAAIVDPEFTDSIPFSITMETGFDVFAHAVESYVSRAASPFTKMLSEYVIEEAVGSIRSLAADTGNRQARDVMSYCSMLMGINLGNTGTALPHRLQYPLGIHTGSSHGAGLAALYIAWLGFEEKYSLAEVNKIYELSGITDITELLDIMQLKSSLSELGASEDMVETMVSEVTGNLKNDPASEEPDIIRKIYKAAL